MQHYFFIAHDDVCRRCPALIPDDDIGEALSMSMILPLPSSPTGDLRLLTFGMNWFPFRTEKTPSARHTIIMLFPERSNKWFADRRGTERMVRSGCGPWNKSYKSNRTDKTYTGPPRGSRSRPRVDAAEQKHRFFREATLPHLRARRVLMDGAVVRPLQRSIVPLPGFPSRSSRGYCSIHALATSGGGAFFRVRIEGDAAASS